MIIARKPLHMNIPKLTLRLPAWRARTFTYSVIMEDPVILCGNPDCEDTSHYFIAVTQDRVGTTVAILHKEMEDIQNEADFGRDNWKDI